MQNVFPNKKEKKSNYQVRGNDRTIKTRQGKRKKKKKRVIVGGGLGKQEEIWELCPGCENGKPLTSWLLDSRGGVTPEKVYVKGQLV